jgi:hypothetical protein
MAHSKINTHPGSGENPGIKPIAVGCGREERRAGVRYQNCPHQVWGDGCPWALTPKLSGAFG